MNHPPSSAQMIGTVLSDRYRLEAKLGSGGMSTVYLARDEVLDRPVAVKLMHGEMTDQPDQLERFNQEARAVAKLSNPNVVAVIDAGEDGGRPYIVLEYVQGETLKQRISRIGALDATEALAYALEVAQGLSVAHEREMVHRDVKPQNVLIDSTGRAKLTDFGISRQLNEEGVTEAGRVVGTTDYVAPEQAMGKEVDPRSDIYSLGIVLYEMLTGDVPFEAENQIGVAMKHVNDELPDIQHERSDLSSASARAVEKATAKNPVDRYQTIEAMSDDLQAALEVEAVRSGGATGEATSILDALPPQRRPVVARETSSRPAVIMLVIALLIAGGAAYVISSGNSGGGGGGGGGGSSSSSEIPLVSATDYDPEGDSEHPEETSLAFDEDRNASAWTTETYEDAALAGKSGVGLYVDAGEPVRATELELRSPTPGWTLEVYGTNDPIPEDLAGWTRLARAPEVQERQRVNLITANRAYRYYLLWVTDPVETETGFSASISDVRLFGQS
ncbi:MAG: serine/threonine protein kinase [Thermoleophilia bacterium]|nr:serine/threonine protein kinase [Thermoleophilia bacterium]